MRRAWVRWSHLVLAVLVAIGLGASTAISGKRDRGIEPFADPDRLEASIVEYDGWPESQLAKASGNIIGQFAAMFRSYPDRVDDWLSPIANRRVAIFAVIALRLADDPTKARAFAMRRQIDSAAIQTVLFFPGGDRFPQPLPRWRHAAFDDILDVVGTIETTAQVTAWQQDILWSAAIVWQDGTVALRILDRMDELFRHRGIEPDQLPTSPSSPDLGGLRERTKAIEARDGIAAAFKFSTDVGYLIAGAWSFASNNRRAYIAQDFALYALDHPDSKAVKAVQMSKGFPQ